MVHPKRFGSLCAVSRCDDGNFTCALKAAPMAFSLAKADSKSTRAVEKVALLLRQPDGSLSVGPRVPLAFDTPATEVREQLRRKTGMRRFGAEKANGAAGTEVKTEGEWRSAISAWRRGRGVVRGPWCWCWCVVVYYGGAWCIHDLKRYSFMTANTQQTATRH